MEDAENLKYKIKDTVVLKKDKWTSLSLFGDFKKKMLNNENLLQLKKEIFDEIEIDRKIHFNNIKKFVNKYIEIMEVID